MIAEKGWEIRSSNVSSGNRDQVIGRIANKSIGIIKVLIEIVRGNNSEASSQNFQERMKRDPEYYLVYVKICNVIGLSDFKVGLFRDD